MQANFRVLKQMEYRGCWLCVRNVYEIFEYLVVIKGAVYSANVVILKTPLQKVLGRDYTPKQLADTTAYVVKMAQTTVDAVLDKKK